MSTENKTTFPFADYAKARGTEPMSYGNYTKSAEANGFTALTKGDYDAAAGTSDKDDADEDADGDDNVAKGDVSVGDLMKSISAYEAIEDALAPDVVEREDELVALLAGGTLSKSERAAHAVELSGILSGDVPAEPLSKSLADRVREGDAELGQVIDASDLLTALTKSISASLTESTSALVTEAETSRTLLKSQGRLIVEQSKVTMQLAERLSKSEAALSEANSRLETVESQPTPRRSVVTIDQVRGREISPAAGKPEALTKSQVISGLGVLVRAAADSDDTQALMQLTKATARFEMGHGLPAHIAAAVRTTQS